MLRQWHKYDIDLALMEIGWINKTIENPNQSEYYVGYKYKYTNGNKQLFILFVTDIGLQFKKDSDIEEVWALLDNGNRFELWLDRKQGINWKKHLWEWKNKLSFANN